MILVDFSPVSVSTGFAHAHELSLDLLRHMVLGKILDYNKKFSREYGQMVIVFDDRSYWRKKLWPGYKASRQKGREDSHLDFELFFKCIDQIKQEFIENLPYKFIQVATCEADDVIGHLAITAKEPTVIVSNDGDFKQCCRNPRVRFWSIQTKKFHEDQTLVEVEYDLHKKILKGDGGDGIRNVFSTLSCTDRQKPVRETLIEHTFMNGVGEDIKDRYEENKKLIDLREIPHDLKDAIVAEFEKPYNTNRGKLFKYITSPAMNTVGSFFSEMEYF